MKLKLLILFFFFISSYLFALPSSAYINAKIRNETRNKNKFHTNNAQYNYIVIRSYKDLRYYKKHYDLCNLGVVSSSKRKKIYNKVIIKNIHFDLDKYCKEEANFGTKNYGKYNKVYNIVTIKNSTITTHNKLNFGTKSKSLKNRIINKVKIKSVKIKSQSHHFLQYKKQRNRKKIQHLREKRLKRKKVW